MNPERPTEDFPDKDGIEVMQRDDEGETREENGTDEEQLGDDEDLDELGDDSAGG